VREWRAAAPAGGVAAGLDAAADPGAAVTGLVRLLEAAPRPPARGRVAPLLRLLGGSPALTAALVAEGEGWPALLDAALAVASRDPAAHRAALEAAGVAGPLPRAELQAQPRPYRRPRLGRVGGRGLPRRAPPRRTVRATPAPPRRATAGG